MASTWRKILLEGDSVAGGGILPDSYTKLLIHSDSVDGSGGFQDSSPSVHQIGKGGDPTHETDEKRFGKTSLYFDGSDYLVVPSHADWLISSNSYTVDMWIKTTGTRGELVGAFNPSSPYEGWLFGIGFDATDGKLNFWNANGSNSETKISTGAVNDNKWNHVAFTKSGTTLRFFINGVLDSTHTLAYVGTASDEDIHIGADTNNSLVRYYTGYMDEVRISKGIARWTSDFLPPSTSNYEGSVTGIASLGIGTSSPTVNLHLDSSATTEVRVDGEAHSLITFHKSSTQVGLVGVQSDGTLKLVTGTGTIAASTQGLLIDSSGNATFAGKVNINPNGTLVNDAGALEVVGDYNSNPLVHIKQTGNGVCLYLHGHDSGNIITAVSPASNPTTKFSVSHQGNATFAGIIDMATTKYIRPRGNDYWKIGHNFATPTGGLALTHSIQIQVFDAADEGFEILNNSNEQLLGIQGSTGNAIFAGNVSVGQATIQSDNSTARFLHIGDSGDASSGLVLEDNEAQWEIQNNGHLRIKKGSTDVVEFDMGTFKSTFSGNIFTTKASDNLITVSCTGGSSDAYFVMANSTDANNTWAIGRPNDGQFFLTHSTGATHNATTQTIAMKMDTSHNATFVGDISIGGAGTNFAGGSGNGPLQLYPGSVDDTTRLVDSSLHIDNTTILGDISFITFGYSNSSVNTYSTAYMGYISTNEGNQGKGALVFGTRNDTGDAAPTERFRINASGSSQFTGSVAFNAGLTGTTGNLSSTLGVTGHITATTGTFSGNLDTADNAKLRLGNGSDFKFYHDGSHSRIENDTGDITVDNTSHGGDISFYTQNSSGTGKTPLTLDSNGLSYCNYNYLLNEKGRNDRIGNDTHLNFDGASGYLNIDGKFSNITGASSHTLAVWFRAETEENAVLISIDDDEGWHYKTVLMTSGDSIAANYTAAGESHTCEYDMGYANEWHHAAVTIDQSGSNTVTVLLYIDGVERADVSGAITPNSSYAIDMGDIGRYHISAGESDSLQPPLTGKESYFDGDIGAVHIYSKKLSAHEVAALSSGAQYNMIGDSQELILEPAGLIDGKWYDISGNSFHVNIHDAFRLRRGRTEVSGGVAGGEARNLYIYNTASATVNSEAMIVFKANRTGSLYTHIAGISGVITDVTGNSADGGLLFKVSKDASALVTALTLNADKSATFAGNITATASSGSDDITSALNLHKVNTSGVGGNNAGASINFFSENADGGTNQATSRIAGYCSSAIGGSQFEGGLKFYTVTDGYSYREALYLKEDLSATFYGEVNFVPSNVDGKNRILSGDGIWTSSHYSPDEYYLSWNWHAKGGTPAVPVASRASWIFRGTTPTDGNVFELRHRDGNGAANDDEPVWKVDETKKMTFTKDATFDGNILGSGSSISVKSSTNENAMIGLYNDKSISIYTDNVERIRIDTTSVNFGTNINTMVYGDGTTHTYFYIDSGNSSGGFIRFRDATNDTRCAIQADLQGDNNAYGDLSFMTGGNVLALNLDRDQDAVFSGNLTANKYMTTYGTYGYHSYGVGYLGATDAEYLNVFHNGAADGGRISVEKSGNGGYRSLFVYTNNTKALEIDTSQNAAFAGAVLSPSGGENIINQKTMDKFTFSVSSATGFAGNAKNCADEYARNTATGWDTYGVQCYVGNGNTGWWKVDTGGSYKPTHFAVSSYHGGSHKPGGDWHLQGSNDDSNWTTLGTGKYNQISPYSYTGSTSELSYPFKQRQIVACTDTSSNYRYFRIMSTTFGANGTNSYLLFMNVGIWVGGHMIDTFNQDIYSEGNATFGGTLHVTGDVTHSSNSVTLGDAFIGSDGGTATARLTVVGDENQTTTGSNVDAALRLINKYGAAYGSGFEIQFMQNIAQGANQRIAGIRSEYTHYSAGIGGDLILYTYTAPSTVVESLKLNQNAVFSGGITATYGTFSADVTAYSDIRLKENINTIDSALDKVVKMRGVTFDRTDNGRSGAGVLADELESIAPELVHDGEYKSVAYGNLTSYLIEAIKELKQEVEVLRGTAS